jgi:hypothetical protein
MHAKYKLVLKAPKKGRASDVFPSMGRTLVPNLIKYHPESNKLEQIGNLKNRKLCLISCRVHLSRGVIAGSITWSSFRSAAWQ